MKYRLGNLMVITTLALGTTSAFAQSPADAQLNPAPALPQGNMPAPATQQSQPNISAPIMAPPGSVMPSGTVPSGTQPIPGSTPIPNTGGPGAPAPAPTGPVTAAAPLSWGAQALADEITLSARDPEISVKKKKQARLSDEKVASLRSKIARLEGDMKSRMRLAEHFEVEGQPDKMIEVLRPVAADLPRKGMLALARGYRMKKDHKEEIRVLEILRAQKDKDYFVHYHLGAAYSSFGDRSTAIERFENALKLNPRFYPAYESLLRETKRDKRWTDAISIAQDTADRFGQKSKALSELCLLFAFQAYLDKAVEICKNAIAKDPEFPRNHVVLGLVLKEKDGSAQAEKVLKKAAQQFPQSEFAQWTYGELSWEKKSQLTALKAYRAAVQANAKSARSQIGLARAAYEEKQYGESLTAFIQACTLNRVHVQEFRKTSSALRRANNYEWSSKFEAGLSKCGIL